MTEDKPTIATRDYEIASWMRQLEDGTYVKSEGAPHRRADWLDANDPYNQLGVVWADDRHTVPLMVEDADGCFSAIWPKDEST